MNRPKPTPHAVEAAVRLVRDALAEHGLLLEHDASWPSATTLIAGAPIRGSWWGHAAGALIYEALTSLEDEVVMTKLVKGKQTLLHRRLWPALVAIGQSHEPWQLTGLSDRALDVLKRAEKLDHLRADELPELGTPKAVGELFRELELRLLAHSGSVHTAEGRHVRVLTSWHAFRTERAVKARDISEPGPAKDRFADAITGWPPPGKGLFPWDSGSRCR